MPDVSNPLAPQPEQKTAADSPAVIIREGEAELVQWVEGLHEDAAKRRTEDAADDQWEEWRRTFWGEQWPGSTPSFKPPIVANELQLRLLEEASDLTDSPLRVFVQKDLQDGERDEAVEKAIQAYWTRNNVDLQILIAVLDGLTLPAGFIQSTWDPTALNGMGEIVTRARKPDTVFPDPDAEDDETWRYYILQDVLDIPYIREHWPQHGWRVKPDSTYSVKLTEGTRPKGMSGNYKGPLYAPGSGLAQEGWAVAQAVVLTCVVKDDDLEEDIQEVKDATGTVTSLKSSYRKKYPNGRMIQVCNGVCLFDGPNPYQGRWRLARVPMLPSPHSFWPPQSTLSGVMELQKAANKSESMVVENALRLNNGIVIADANSGIKPDNFGNIPGQILLKTPGSQVNVVYPPPMPGDMVNGGERLRNVMRTVLGFPPSRIGQGQRGNVSPELTETEISQAMSLTRLRGRLLFNAVQNVVQMIFANMSQFYTVPRSLPYIQGSSWESIRWKPILKPEDYSAHVDPASFQIVTRSMMKRLYLALAQNGRISTEDLLKGLEIPDAEAKWKRLEYELQLQAMAKGKKK